MICTRLLRDIEHTIAKGIKNLVDVIRFSHIHQNVLLAHSDSLTLPLSWWSFASKLLALFMIVAHQLKLWHGVDFFHGEDVFFLLFNLAKPAMPLMKQYNSL